MKVITTTVGRSRPENEAENPERLEAARQALKKAATLGADLLVLPGGFLTAGNNSRRDALAASLISEAKPLSVAVIFGVDTAPKNLSQDYVAEIIAYRLPFYGYAWSPSEDIVHRWRQRSTTNENESWASETACKEVRLLKIRDQAVAVLMCGEIFSQRIRQALSKFEPRPALAVDVAHVGAGFRVWQGMQVLARLGIASVCSVHAQCECAMKHCFVPPDTKLSSRKKDSLVIGPPRIEMKLWKF